MAFKLSYKEHGHYGENKHNLPIEGVKIGFYVVCLTIFKCNSPVNTETYSLQQHLSVSICS